MICRKKFSVILTVITILFSNVSLIAQDKKSLTFGALHQTRISVEDFKKQSGVTIQTNYSIDSVVVYFNIPSEKHILTVPYFPFLDSSQFNKAVDLLMPGATVNIYCKIRNKISLDKDTAWKVYLIQNYKTEALNFDPPLSHKEFLRITKLKFIEGVIYFSGHNFPSLKWHNLPDSDPKKLQELFTRCAPGTVIVFDEVKASDSYGGVEVISKKLILD